MSDDSTRPIVIKRKKVVAGGAHGGAWKIAYADFVTAMMAFFLLMWLLGSTAEGQKIETEEQHDRNDRGPRVFRDGHQAHMKMIVQASKMAYRGKRPGEKAFRMRFSILPFS